MKRIQRQFAMVLSLVIVAIPLIAFMPWSGTEEPEQYSLNVDPATGEIVEEGKEAEE